MAADLYARVTTRILADLERGVRPWTRPWRDDPKNFVSRPLRANGGPYRGVNTILLWAEALAQGYNSPIWLTYCQAQDLGAQVRRGERGSTVIYANRVTRTEPDDAGRGHEISIPLVRAYSVFNVAQIDGLPEQYHTTAPLPLPAERLAHAERFIAATGATIHHGGNLACYLPSQDRVLMPPFERFPERAAYYGVLAHELVHWTGHPTRLNRDFGRQRWGDGGYALEELVAELGAAFIAADLQFTTEPRPDHASYIAEWLKVLRDDHRAIFIAAAHAQRAADLLNGTCRKEDPQLRDTHTRTGEAAP